MILRLMNTPRWIVLGCEAVPFQAEESRQRQQARALGGIELDRDEAVSVRRDGCRAA